MTEINRIIHDVKSNSGVDNFTSNLDKAFTKFVEDIVEDIRTYKEDSVCAFKQEMLAEFIKKKYLTD